MKKNVLITGSSRGIGRSCALAFAKKGWHVFINSRHSLEQLEEVHKEILELGGTCTMLPADVSCPNAVRSLFEHIRSDCGGVDVLVNNAGIAHFGLLSDLSDTQWDEILRGNLSSAFYCCREAIPYMVSQKSGKIINISSIWGVSGASCEVAYSSAKSGLNGLTRALAKELAPSNIQVNAIACGVIDTEMNAHLDTEERRALCEDIPAGHFADPQEVARFVLSLAAAPPYLTGQIISMDGGYL